MLFASELASCSVCHLRLCAITERRTVIMNIVIAMTTRVLVSVACKHTQEMAMKNVRSLREFKQRSSGRVRCNLLYETYAKRKSVVGMLKMIASFSIPNREDARATRYFTCGTYQRRVKVSHLTQGGMRHTLTASSA